LYFFFNDNLDSVCNFKLFLVITLTYMVLLMY